MIARAGLSGTCHSEGPECYTDGSGVSGAGGPGRVLEAWLGLERRVGIAGRNGNFLGAEDVRCRRQEPGLGCLFVCLFSLLAVLHGIQGLSSLTRD